MSTGLIGKQSRGGQMNRIPMKIAVSILMLIGGLAAAEADKIDDIVKEQMAARHIPGVAIGVVRDGKLTLARGYGLANTELNSPVTENTVFEIGSMTKQFTATCIMMLVEEAKIGLDEKITKYLSEMPEAWKEITVRQLLTHTSGIKGYTEVGDFMSLARNPHTQQEIIKLVADKPLDFASGEKWAYSNSGYFILGMIIEKVTGKRFEEFLSDRIFKPLGMTVTRTSDPGAVIPNRASGYMWAGKLMNAPALQPSSAFAAGFLVSTVGDLAKWDAALYSEKLIKSSSLREMWTPVKLNKGGTSGYGFGWGLENQGGHKLVAHGGGTAAFSTMISRYVDDKLTVVVLTNLAGADGARLARGIAATYVPALAAVAEKPVEDKDPALTAKLRAVVVSASDNKLDQDLFTPEAKAALFPDKAREAAGFLKPLGALKSFTLVGQRNQDKTRIFRYKCEYEKGSLMISYILTEEGKIAGMGVMPN
jgi:D-alanyl-D-alanine carboxypeptidase